MTSLLGRTEQLLCCYWWNMKHRKAEEREKHISKEGGVTEFGGKTDSICQLMWYLLSTGTSVITEYSKIL